MSYEIPQQLEYKEKIIFGLTFSQLLWAIIFSPLALALLFKVPLAMPYRISLALIPAGIAAVFMFTNLPKRAKQWLEWQSWKKLVKNDQKMNKFLAIEKIENSIIQTK